MFCFVVSLFFLWNVSLGQIASTFYIKNLGGSLELMPAAVSTNIGSPKKQIALTFDDGPNGKYTEQVLQILKDNNIKVTFFVCGDSVAANPDLLKKEYNMGNEVENHTYSHRNLAKLPSKSISEELSKANDEIYKAIQVHPAMFRPPYGSSSSEVNIISKSLNLRKVTWDYMVDDYDTSKTSSDKIASLVIMHAHSGAIIDMHDGGGNRQKTVEALPIIIADLKKKGYEFVTVSTMLGVKPYQD
jgi:peptidoglycan/xylan/chitin deacetylase (PgdA/CDA1 family)